jgi:hypothetical protein
MVARGRFSRRQHLRPALRLHHGAPLRAGSGSRPSRRWRNHPKTDDLTEKDSIMFDALPLTNLFALFVGLYMIAGGVGLLVDRAGYATLVDELVASPALTLIAAVFIFALGAMMVSVHNIWTSPVAIMVSLAGWGALVEGLLMLAFRRAFLGLVKMFPFNAATMIPFGLFVLGLGGWLVFSALT